jgi:dihydrofolate reductase
MRKVLLNLAVSLDGFIEGPHGEFDWCFTDQDYGMKDFMKRIDSIIMGRKSHEVLLQYEKENPYPQMKTYVFSTTSHSKDRNTVVLGGDVKQEMKKILGQPGKDLWLFGGASLVSAFINLNLVDELWLAVHPLLLGSGKPLFQDVTGRISFGLKTTRQYSSGLVQLVYEKGEQP